MEVKIECICGLRFKFDVDPIGRRMPSAVLCPKCGTDATTHANAYIESKLSHIPDVSRQAVEVALRQNRLFCSVATKHIQFIAREAIQHYYQPEQPVIRQDTDGFSMFILFSGTVKVLEEGNDGTTFIARLKPGDCFGEMSLLTGARRSATVLTETDCAMVEILNITLKRVFDEDPKLLESLSHLLAKRKASKDSRSQAKEIPPSTGTPNTEHFKRKLTAFFRL